jgi:MFS family permease
MVAHFTHHVSNTLLAPLQPLIRDAFTLSYAQSGFLASAFFVAQGLSQAPIGILADRIGSRTVIIVGLIATGAVMVLIGLSGGYWHLLLLLVLMGLIAGTYHAPAASLLARTFPPERRGGALGMHVVGGNLSFFATPLLAGGLAASTHDWRSPYLVFAIAPILAGVFLFVTLPALREHAEHSSSAGLLKDLGSVIGVVGPLLSLAIVFQMLYAAVYAFLALYLVDARGFDPAAAAVLVAAPFIAGLAGAPIGGFLSDRVGRKPVIIVAIVLQGPLLYILTQVPTMLIAPVLAVMGLVGAARMPVIEGFLLDRAPANRRATTLGAYYFLAQELGGFAAPVLGILAVTFGIAGAYVNLGLVASAMSLAILLLARRL